MKRADWFSRQLADDDEPVVRDTGRPPDDEADFVKAVELAKARTRIARAREKKGSLRSEKTKVAETNRNGEIVSAACEVGDVENLRHGDRPLLDCKDALKKICKMAKDETKTRGKSFQRWKSKLLVCSAFMSGQRKSIKLSKNDDGEEII